MKRLEKWQAEKLMDNLRPSLVFMSKLKSRMQQRGFPPDSRLFKLVDDAHEAVNDLFIELHYSSCDNVGRSDH